MSSDETPDEPAKDNGPSPLRSVHTMTTTYTNEAGEVVASYESHQNWKSMLNPSSGAISPVEQEHAPRFLDLTSDEFKDLPDGNYKLTKSNPERIEPE